MFYLRDLSQRSSFVEFRQISLIKQVSTYNWDKLELPFLSSIILNRLSFDLNKNSNILASKVFDDSKIIRYCKFSKRLKSEIIYIEITYLGYWGVIRRSSTGSLEYPTALAVLKLLCFHSNPARNYHLTTVSINGWIVWNSL